MPTDPKDSKQAAGVVFVTPRGLALFVKRSATSSHPGEWAFPAGMIEAGEDAAAAARRECLEEIGHQPAGDLSTVLDRHTSGEGVDFTAFKSEVPAPFLPMLNDEHEAFAWARVELPPLPLFPGAERALDALGSQGAADRRPDGIEADEGGSERLELALDRESVRQPDADGRLHVSVTNISKAGVSKYFGREVPGWRKLGLEPERVYRMLRDPDELRRGAPTFNRLPLLSDHVPLTAASHRHEYVIGTLGESANFAHPYLQNGLAVWTKPGIDGINSDEKKELSAAYRYRADMTPGSYEGEDYDGVMRDIVGNHVALVKDGRAGDDVVVGDKDVVQASGVGARTYREIGNMTVKIAQSRKAALLLGALTAHFTPLLAMDAKPDFSAVVDGITAKNFKERRPTVLAALTKALDGVKLADGTLAMDASTDTIKKVFDALDPVDPVEGADNGATDPNAGPPKDKTMDGDPVAKIKAFLQGKVSPEVLAQLDEVVAGSMAGDADKDDEEKEKAKPAEDAEKKDMIDKPAMDAAIAAATDKAKKDVLAQQRGINEATRAVRPYVGNLEMAFDSADEVYRKAFDMLGVKVDGVHPSAFGAVLAAQPKPERRRAAEDTTIAMDAAEKSSFDKMFPNAARIQV